MTAKQLEQETGCKIMVRGRGSMRDKKKVDTYAKSFPLTMSCASISNLLLSSSSVQSVSIEILSKMIGLRQFMGQFTDECFPIPSNRRR